MCDEEESCTEVEIDETNSRLSLTDLPIEVRRHRAYVYLSLYYFDR